MIPRNINCNQRFLRHTSNERNKQTTVHCLLLTVYLNWLRRLKFVPLSIGAVSRWNNVVNISTEKFDTLSQPFNNVFALIFRSNYSLQLWRQDVLPDDVEGVPSHKRSSKCLFREQLGFPPILANKLCPVCLGNSFITTLHKGFLRRYSPFSL